MTAVASGATRVGGSAETPRSENVPQKFPLAGRRLPGFGREPGLRISSTPWLTLRYLALGLLIALAYFGSALIANALRFTGNVDAVWPPVGVGIVALYFFGLRMWPAVLLGDILADSPQALPLVTSIGQTVGNMLEVILAVVLINYYLRKRSPFEHVDDVGRLIGILLLATATSATFGAVSLRLGGVISTTEIPRIWQTWWLGDSCGALLVVPFALAWFGWPATGWPRRSALEMAAVAGAIFVLSDLAFSTRQPLTYLVFPALIYAGIRFGQRGSTLAVLGAAVIAIWKTAHAAGPYALHSITRETASTQLYVAFAALSTLLLTTLVTERRMYAAGLSASRQHLIDAAANDRQRLERNLHDGAQQRLTALAIRLAAAGRRRDSDAADANAVLREAGTELGRAIDELRELAQGIHPASLTRFGLDHAIRAITDRSSLLVASKIALPEERLNPVAESTAYYVVAEAISNAQTHAHASRAWLSAEIVDETLDLRIIDNGVGGAHEQTGSGLRGLRDRVEGVGGTFVLTSPVGAGTQVAARIPL